MQQPRLFTEIRKRRYKIFLVIVAFVLARLSELACTVVVVVVVSLLSVVKWGLLSLRCLHHCFSLSWCASSVLFSRLCYIHVHLHACALVCSLLECTCVLMVSTIYMYIYSDIHSDYIAVSGLIKWIALIQTYYGF